VTQRVGVQFDGSARGAVGAAQQTAAAIAGVRREAVASSPGLTGMEHNLGRMERGAIAGSGALRGLGRSVAFASTGFLGAFGLAAAVRGAADELVNQVKIQARVQAVLRSTGGVAGVTAGEIDRLAESTSRKTGADRLQVKSAEAVLLTFTKVRDVAGEGNDVFSQTIRLANDMSVQLGQDLTSSVTMLGKALQDPITGMTALRRAGITLDAQQRQNIKTLVEQGNVLGAQKLILREVQTDFGGAAAKVGQVAPWMRLRESLKQLSADALKPLLPVIDDLSKRADKWAYHLEHDSHAQQRLKHDVEEGIHVAGEFVHAANSVAGALGGWKKTLELLLALKVSSTLLGWAGGLKLLTGAEGAGGLLGANAAAGSLLTKLRALSGLGVITVELLLAEHFITKYGLKNALRAGIDPTATLGPGVANDQTITVGGKTYPIGTGAAWTALIKAGWKPPKGVNVGNVTAAQEISAAKSLGGYASMSTSSTVGAGKLANPVPGGVFQRVDQGVDYQVKLVRAIAAGVIVSVGGGMAGPAGQAGRSTIIRQRFAKPVRVNGRTYYGAYYSEGVALVQGGDYVQAGAPVMKGGSVEIGFLLGRSLEFPPLRGGVGSGTQPDQSGSDFKSLVDKLGGGTGGGGGGAAPPTAGNVPGPKAPAQLPIRLQLALSKADQAAAAAALTPGKADDRRAIAQQRRAILDEIAWLKQILKTKLSSKSRLTYEDLLTGAETDLGNVTTRTKAGGAGVGVIESLRNTITADLRNLPAQLTPAEQVAVNHLKALKKKLVPGLDPKDLADVRAGISRWGRALRDAVKNEATKAAQAAAAAAQEATRLWERGWQNAASHVLRNFQEQVVQPQLDAFDKETQAGLAKLQNQYGAKTPEEQALADFQAKRSADAEAKQKGDLQQQIADTEAQLAALRSGGGSGGTLIDIATGARTGIPGDGTDPASQQEALQKQLLDLQDQYNQLQLDDQEAALQAAADQSRTAADEQLSAAETTYQDQRDQQRQALGQSLDDWQKSIEDKKKSWLDFLNWLAANGYSSAGVTNPGADGAAITSFAEASAAGTLPDIYRALHGSGMATGGKVPGKYVGRDSIPTLLEPGETVLDRRLTAALERLVLQGGGSGLGGGVGDVYLDSYKVGKTIASPVDDAQQRRISYKLQRA
jgi:hypothetical protein